jgi:hypothetical protein
MYVGFHGKFLLFLSDTKLEFDMQILIKIPTSKISLKSVQLCHANIQKTDKMSGMKNLIVAFLNCFALAPNSV